jgi:Cu2+-exporting ATPase
VEEAHRHELTIPLAEEFYTEPGLGVSALVEGVRVLLGNADWLTQQGISLSDSEQNQAQQLASGGKTVVYVAADGQLAGLIGVTDTLRPDAKATVSRLRQMGLRVMLLTGDRLQPRLPSYKLRVNTSQWLAMASTMPPLWHKQMSAFLCKGEPMSPLKPLKLF